jgi:hypothetical protein
MQKHWLWLVSMCLTVTCVGAVLFLFLSPHGGTLDRNRLENANKFIRYA